MWALCHRIATLHTARDEPCECVFNQMQMRAHLYSCFEDGKLAPFPHKKLEVIGGIVKNTANGFAVHCQCQMPEMKHFPMLECDGSRKSHCEKVSDAVVSTIETV